MNNDVTRYYDNNTRRFLLIGQGGKSLSIRRAVWAPGVANRDEAMQYVNARIAEELATLAPVSRIVDLGCGVGGSIIYLSRLIEAEYLGITISEVQAKLATRNLATFEVSRATIEQADYTDASFWRDYREPFDAAFSIESFVHVPDLLRHLGAFATRLRPGGKLIIVDDVIASGKVDGNLTKRERRWLREFRTGWHANGLSRLDDLIAAASAAGLALERSQDLTSYIELDRPRDMIARVWISLFRWWPLRRPWFQNILGGNALQLALKSGVIQYRLLVFTARHEP
ncbi:MAG: SAM-dependent methyltransferase, partial [Spirochaetota bacterium]